MGFEPEEVEAPRIEDKLKAARKRGWGIQIIKGLMDEVEINSGAIGTTRRHAQARMIVRMKKMTETLKVTLDRRDGLAVIYTEGYINNQGGEEIAKVAYELIEDGVKILLLNLEGNEDRQFDRYLDTDRDHREDVGDRRQAGFLQPDADDRQDLPHHGPGAVRWCLWR